MKIGPLSPPPTTACPHDPDASAEENEFPSVAKVKPVPRKSTETNPAGPLPPLHAPPDPKPVFKLPHHKDVPAADVQSSARSKFVRSSDTTVPEVIVLIKTPLKNNALGRKSPLAPSPPQEATFGTSRNAFGSGKYA